MLFEKKAKPPLVRTTLEKCFWAHDGQIFCDLAGLREALEKMSEEVFVYHVNGQKNDFSQWVGDALGDKTLVKQLGSLKKRQAFLKKVDARIRNFYAQEPTRDI